MTSADTSPSPPQLSIADVFLGHLAAGNFEQLATVLEPDVVFSALLPDGMHEWRGPERAVAAFVRWFGRVDQYALVEASIGRVLLRRIDGQPIVLAAVFDDDETVGRAISVSRRVVDDLAAALARPTTPVG
jgi:hypothetical protein